MGIFIPSIKNDMEENITCTESYSVSTIDCMKFCADLAYSESILEDYILYSCGYDVLEEGFKDSVKSAWTKFKEWVKNVWENIKKFFKKLKDKIVGIFKKNKDGKEANTEDLPKSSTSQDKKEEPEKKDNGPKVRNVQKFNTSGGQPKVIPADKEKIRQDEEKRKDDAQKRIDLQNSIAKEHERNNKLVEINDFSELKRAMDMRMNFKRMDKNLTDGTDAIRSEMVKSLDDFISFVKEKGYEEGEFSDTDTSSIDRFFGNSENIINRLPDALKGESEAEKINNAISEISGVNIPSGSSLFSVLMEKIVKKEVKAIVLDSEKASAKGDVSLISHRCDMYIKEAEKYITSELDRIIGNTDKYKASVISLADMYTKKIENMVHPEKFQNQIGRFSKYMNNVMSKMQSVYFKFVDSQIKEVKTYSSAIAKFSNSLTQLKTALEKMV